MSALLVFDGPVELWATPLRCPQILRRLLVVWRVALPGSCRPPGGLIDQPALAVIAGQTARTIEYGQMAIRILMASAPSPARNGADASAAEFAVSARARIR